MYAYAPVNVCVFQIETYLKCTFELVAGFVVIFACSFSKKHDFLVEEQVPLRRFDPEVSEHSFVIHPHAEWPLHEQLSELR